MDALLAQSVLVVARLEDEAYLEGGRISDLHQVVFFR